MDALRDWASGLPPEATAKIAARLPCRADRGKMAAVCHEWRTRAQVPALPAALPWLLMPTADSTRVHCFLSDYHVHHHINEPHHGARYFGSHDGAWLFLAYGQTQNHALVNLHDHDAVIHPVPDQVECDGEVHHGTVILAATLSAPPDDPNCVGACIFTRWADIRLPRRCAFWHMGSITANDFLPEPLPEPEPSWPAPADLEVEDIVFHAAAFHILTRGEHIILYQPALDEDGHVALPLAPQLNLIPFEPGGRNYDGLVVHARYLVESRLDDPALAPELLMVVRFTQPNHLMTLSFRVFRATPPNDDQDAHPGGGDEMEEDDQDAEENDEGEEVDPDQDAAEVQDQGGAVDDQGEEMDVQDAEEEVPPSSWEELHTLDGRMLFVGRGCSRSYSVARYPGFTAGVYFLDDQSFYDEEMIFAFGVNERQYPCGDNGKWSEGPPPVVIRCPWQNPSNRSPPVWLLP